MNIILILRPINVVTVSDAGLSYAKLEVEFLIFLSYGNAIKFILSFKVFFVNQDYWTCESFSSIKVY